MAFCPETWGGFNMGKSICDCLRNSVTSIKMGNRIVSWADAENSGGKNNWMKLTGTLGLQIAMGYDSLKKKKLEKSDADEWITWMALTDIRLTERNQIQISAYV